MVEKRIRPRVRFRADGKLAVSGKWHEVSCENISMSGMLLISDCLFPVGIEGSLEILQECGEDSLLLSVDVQVVRIIEPKIETDQYRIGVAYTKLESEVSLHLLNIVRYQSGGQWSNDSDQVSDC